MDYRKFVDDLPWWRVHSAKFLAWVPKLGFLCHHTDYYSHEQSQNYVTDIGQQHTHNNRFTALCPGLPRWAGTRRNIHPSTILNPDHHPIFISFLRLPRSIASSLFKLRSWQCFCTTSFHVLFGLPLGLEPYTSYSTHFFTQSVSSLRSTCPYHRNLFCCSINIISSIPSLSLNSLLGTVFYLNITHPSDHSHLCSLKCHLIFFPDRPGHTYV